MRANGTWPRARATIGRVARLDWQTVGGLAAVGLAVGLAGTKTGRSVVADLTQRGARLTRSTLDANKSIPTPPPELARQAAAVAGRPVDVTAYALARMVRSEGGSQPADAKRLRIWVALNDSRELRWTVLRTLTYSKLKSRNGLFGNQVSRRYSTAADPFMVDLLIAERTLAEYSSGGADPTGGAVKFADVSSFGGIQPGTGTYAELVARWGREGLRPVRVEGAPEDLVLFRRVG